MLDAVEAYKEAVTGGEFPAEEHSHVEEDRRRPVLIGILVEIHSFETTGAAQTLGRGRVPDRSGQYGHGDDRCRE